MVSTERKMYNVNCGEEQMSDLNPDQSCSFSPWPKCTCFSVCYRRNKNDIWRDWLRQSVEGHHTESLSVWWESVCVIQQASSSSSARLLWDSDRSSILPSRITCGNSSPTITTITDVRPSRPHLAAASRCRAPLLPLSKVSYADLRRGPFPPYVY